MRYAVYAVPGADDAAAPEAIRLREAVEGWYATDAVRDLTVDARRYGFHATLKAPMRLADGRTEAELRAAVEAFAATRAPVVIPAPRPAALGGFRALLPDGDERALTSLAEAVVRELDGFRAPLDEAEQRRRRPEHLTPRERELLERWGYPYVLDEFRFHLTLTDRVPAARAAEIDAALAEHFASVAGIDVPLTALAISVEREPRAPFELLSLHPFTDRPALEPA
jgi:hypothetical protein